MIRILIGGSPCTHWSVAQHKDRRETKPEGIGWELFQNYTIAKDKFLPDYFLYENNWSANKAIKEQISLELGEPLMRINSSLVSAQMRDRFYVFNWSIDQPKDRGIVVKDILEDGYLLNGDKSYCLRACYGKTGNNPLINFGSEQCSSRVAVRVGTAAHKDGVITNGQAYRVYDVTGKSVTLKSGAGGYGGNTGLYAIPYDDSTEYPEKAVAVWRVKDGRITQGDKSLPVKLEDGDYIIRKLTPVECERLQTLPDNYTAGISNTQRYRCIGNGWTAEVIIHILNGALHDVPRDEKIVVLSMYDGIGTGRYCLDKMGFTNVEYHAYEIDKNAIKIAMKNYPDIIQHGDAFQVRSMPRQWNADKC